MAFQVQLPDPLDPAEATLALVGLTRILNGDMPLVGIMLQRQVLALPAKIQSLANQFAADELPRKLEMPRPFGYAKMLDRFTQPLSEQELDKILSKFPDNVQDQAIQFGQYLQGVYKHVSDMLPTQQYQTAIGPKYIEPTGDRLWKFYSQYWVIDQPLISLTLAQSGALLPEQILVLQQFYPTVYEQCKSALLGAVSKKSDGQHLYKTGAFIALPPRADRGLTTFLGQKVVPQGTNKHQITPDQMNVPGGAVPSQAPNKSLETPGQKAASV